MSVHKFHWAKNVHFILIHYKVTVIAMFHTLNAFVSLIAWFSGKLFQIVSGEVFSLRKLGLLQTGICCRCFFKGIQQPSVKVFLVENVYNKQLHIEQHFKCKVSAVFYSTGSYIQTEICLCLRHHLLKRHA